MYKFFHHLLLFIFCASNNFLFCTSNSSSKIVAVSSEWFYLPDGNISSYTLPKIVSSCFEGKLNFVAGYNPKRSLSNNVFSSFNFGIQISDYIGIIGNFFLNIHTRCHKKYNLSFGMGSLLIKGKFRPSWQLGIDINLSDHIVIGSSIGYVLSIEDNDSIEKSLENLNFLTRIVRSVFGTSPQTSKIVASRLSFKEVEFINSNLITGRFSIGVQTILI